MTPLLFLLASFAGGVGAGLRCVVERGVTSVTRGRFPWGIVVVNVTGSFALGLVTASIPESAFIVGLGLLGGYTTFSTALLDTLALWEDGKRPGSVLHLVGTFVASMIAALAGLGAGSLL